MSLFLIPNWRGSASALMGSWPGRRSQFLATKLIARSLPDLCFLQARGSRGQPGVSGLRSWLSYRRRYSQQSLFTRCHAFLFVCLMPTPPCSQHTQTLFSPLTAWWPPTTATGLKSHTHLAILYPPPKKALGVNQHPPCLLSAAERLSFQMHYWLQILEPEAVNYVKAAC